MFDDELRVRFSNILDDAFVLEVNAYLAVVNIGDFKELAEELNFEVLTMLNKHQLQFALPEHRLQLTNVANETAFKLATLQTMQRLRAVLENRGLWCKVCLVFRHVYLMAASLASG